MYLILVFIFVFLCWYIIRKDPLGFHNPLTIFVYSLFLYRSAVILNVLFLNNSFGYSYILLIHQMFLLDTFLLGIILTNLDIINKKYTWNNNLKIIKYTEKIKWVFYMILTFGFLLYITFLINAYGSIFNIFTLNSRSDQFLLKRGFGIFEFGSYFMLLGFTGLGLYSMLKYNRLINKSMLPVLILYGGTLMFFLMSGERGEILKFLLPLIGIYSIFKGIPKSVLYLYIPFGILFMQLIAFLRAYPLDSINLDLILNSLNNDILNPVGKGEFFASTNVDITILNDLQNNDLIMKYGSTYLHAFLNLIPFGLFEKQLLLSEWYVQKYNNNLFQEGGGLAFSILSEGIVNFGYYGGVIGGILTGLVFRVITKVMRNKSNVFFNILLGVSTLAFCFFLQRSGLGNMLKIYLFSVVIPILFLKFFYHKK